MAALFLPDSGRLTFACGRRRRGLRMAYYAAGTGVDGSSRWRGDRGAATVTMTSRSPSARNSRARINSRRCFAKAWRWSRRRRPISTAMAARRRASFRPPHSLAYATESMRLTTRLMQLASWLLIRRAVSEGELTPEQAVEEQRKIKLPVTGSEQPCPRARRPAGPLARADRAERQAAGAGDPARPDARATSSCRRARKPTIRSRRSCRGLRAAFGKEAE